MSGITVPDLVVEVRNPAVDTPDFKCDTASIVDASHTGPSDEEAIGLMRESALLQAYLNGASFGSREW